MCGIVGFLETAASARGDSLQATVNRMTDQLRHRGPDDAGGWVDAANGVALGHRRLAILDVSAEGHQPMVSADGRFVLIFNGELYNFAVLRDVLSLLGHRFRGHSDTEILLAGFSEWGIEVTLEKSVGMFALAVWDRQLRQLSLARDRMGEKPLYYGWQGATFMFSSELKALQLHPAWIGDVDRDAIAAFMRYGYIPAPYSIYRGIAKLTPGSFLTLAGHSPARLMPAPRQYWSAQQVAAAAEANAFAGNDDEAVDALESVLGEAVRLQMVADVPVGAFLSGGIDSTTVVALMQSQSTRPVKTFSIGFHDPTFDEAPRARAVARHLGTEHTELYVTAEEALRVIPALPAVYDEPFADSSQIPTLLVAGLASRHVKVSLSGDGGDELFYGYSRYEAAYRSWKRAAAVPSLLQTGVHALLCATPAPVLNAALQFSSPLIARRRRSRREWDHVAAALADTSGDSFYRAFVSHWVEPASVVRRANEPPDVFTERPFLGYVSDFRKRMMYMDAVSYLADGILVKVDRAAMSVSLETRVPLLDHRVVEFAWRVPMHLKQRDGQGKWLLRQVLHKYVPETLVNQQKMGFSVPLDSWLRGPLRDWAEDLLAAPRLNREGFFDASLIRYAWDTHLSGRVDQSALLWSVLMFQSWLDSSHESKTAPALAGAAT
jgi:asparagine synthase (glutamine-hydrolysing)